MLGETGEETQPGSEEEANRAPNELEEDLEETKSSDTSSKKSRSRSKSKTKSKSRSRSSSKSKKSRSRSGSRTKLKDDDGKKKWKKGRPKRSASASGRKVDGKTPSGEWNSEVLKILLGGGGAPTIANGVESSDDAAKAELSALEAELNRSISLFTMQNTPNPDSLKEILTNTGSSDLEPFEKNRGRKLKELPITRRSQSKIHLLEGEDEEDKSMKRQYVSLNDLGTTVMSARNTTSSSSNVNNASWAKFSDESSRPHKPSSSLAAILTSGKKSSGDPSEISGNTESTSMQSSIDTTTTTTNPSLSSLPAPRPEQMKFSGGITSPSARNIVRAASLSKIMSYSSMQDDDDLLLSDGMMEATSRGRANLKLASLLIAKKKNPMVYESMIMEDENNNNDKEQQQHQQDLTLTPTSTRNNNNNRILQMGGRLKKQLSTPKLGSKPAIL